MRRSADVVIRMQLNLSDMKKEELPLVSVPVITYNSAKTVIETLESVKAQTYPNIELIISDDCSTDNTVELCCEWIEKNNARFARTELITVEKNTGVSANNNRVEAACLGEWVKGIAGDDIMLPNCIQDCMDYVNTHPDTVYLFGRQDAFGADAEYCEKINKNFDYSFFSLSKEEQLHYLIFKGNCVPATTVFYNRKKAKEIGITNDERIPLLEDWPKWINLLRAGVKLHFVDKVLVKYRIGGISTNTNSMYLSRNYYKNTRMFCFLYQYPEWYRMNKDEAIERVVKEEMEIYQWLLDSEKQLVQIQQSKAYRFGKILLKPFKWFTR